MSESFPKPPVRISSAVPPVSVSFPVPPARVVRPVKRVAVLVRSTRGRPIPHRQLDAYSAVDARQSHHLAF